jgi:hypothetical protein
MKIRGLDGRFKFNGGKLAEKRDKLCPDCGEMIMRKSDRCRHCSQKWERGPRWKSYGYGYQALHIRIKKLLGKASKCEHCGTKTSTRYDWANISHEYKYDINDWISLCHKCHFAYDKTGRKANLTKQERYGWNNKYT